MASKYIFSENKVFAIDNHSSDYLYVLRKKKNVIKKYPFLYINDDDKSSDYVSVKSVFTFEDDECNDCLQFGETLATNKSSHYKGKKSMFFVKGVGKDFGVSDKKNIQLSYEYFSNIGDNVDPKEGEAYALVRVKIEEDKVPYHVAFVLFRDGDSSVTLEADAGNLSMKEPVFDIYSISGRNGKTFFESFSEEYTTDDGNGDEPIAIVLSPK